MSEAPDQGVGAGTTPASTPVAAEAPATTTETPSQEDISTEDFDRAPSVPGEPDDLEEEAAPSGQSESGDEPPAAAPAADAETIEVEVNGQKFKVPKGAEKGFLQEADYTRKTQKHAEDVRNWEAQRTQQAESLTQLRAEHAAVDAREADLAGIDEKLGIYRKLSAKDWADLKAENVEEYRAHSENYDDLRRQRTIAEDALSAAKDALKERETSLATERTAADEAKLRETWGQTNAVLSDKIEGWGPDKFQEIGAWANKEFGITSDQLVRTTDPVSWQLANRAMKAEARVKVLEAAANQRTAADNTAKVTEVQPAAKPAGAATPRGVKDDLGTKEWMKRRAEQLRRKAG